MRSILWVVLLLACTRPADAAIAFVAGRADGLGTNCGTSGAIDSTGANLIVLTVAADKGVSIVTGDISDSKSNASWQLLDTYEGAFAKIHVFYHAAPSVGASHTFTVTQAGGACAVTVGAFSGAHASAPFDNEDGAACAAATACSPATGITPSQNDALIISALAYDGPATPTAPTGFTPIGGVEHDGATFYGSFMAYKIQTSASAEDPEWALNAAKGMVTQVASFKVAAAGGATCNGGLLLLGVGGC